MENDKNKEFIGDLISSTKNILENQIDFFTKNKHISLNSKFYDQIKHHTLPENSIIFQEICGRYLQYYNGVCPQLNIEDLTALYSDAKELSFSKELYNDYSALMPLFVTLIDIAEDKEYYNRCFYSYRYGIDKAKESFDKNPYAGGVSDFIFRMYLNNLLITKDNADFIDNISKYLKLKNTFYDASLSILTRLKDITNDKNTSNDLQLLTQGIICNIFAKNTIKSISVGIKAILAEIPMTGVLLEYFLKSKKGELRSIAFENKRKVIEGITINLKEKLTERLKKELYWDQNNAMNMIFASPFSAKNNYNLDFEIKSGNKYFDKIMENIKNADAKNNNTYYNDLINNAIPIYQKFNQKMSYKVNVNTFLEILQYLNLLDKSDDIIKIIKDYITDDIKAIFEAVCMDKSYEIRSIYVDFLLGINTFLDTYIQITKQYRYSVTIPKSNAEIFKFIKTSAFFEKESYNLPFIVMNSILNITAKDAVFNLIINDTTFTTRGLLINYINMEDLPFLIGNRAIANDDISKNLIEERINRGE